MTAPFDQDDEPTAMFVPTWDDADDGADVATETPPVATTPEAPSSAAAFERPHVDGAVAIESLPVDRDEDTGRWTPADEDATADDATGMWRLDDEDEDPEETAERWRPPEPEETLEAQPVEPWAAGAAGGAMAVAERDETGTGTLRRKVPEPVVEARRTQQAPGSSPAAGSWAGQKLRAASGLLVLVVVAGIGLAAAIGLVALAITFALQRLVGG